MNIIQLNKFSELHDEKNIIFCKTDYLMNEFKYIRSLQNEVILISGNSDYSINDEISKNLPKNVKVWYAQNVLTYHEKIKPIPMGIENKIESKRMGHGVGYYDRVKIKEELLSRNLDVLPTKKIYSNFNIHTNFNHRNTIKQKSLILPHIDWEEPNQTLENFFNKVLEYEIILCPAGNGVDTHRIWEVLYSNRIPMTIKTGNFKIYDLYEQLPIIILDSVNELENYDLIKQKYEVALTKKGNLYLSDFDYWKNEILKSL